VAEPSGSADAIIEVRGLAKVFPVRRGVVLRRTVGQVQAVDDVSLTLRRGRTLGLVGESGSGKSTLARMLVGVERPTRGQVLVDGRDVSTMSRAARRRLRRRVQMVFQDPYTSLNPRMSVGEIVGEPFRIHPDAVPKGGRDRAVKELLELVGLDPAHVHRYPHQFSGGQRQRIGIARALAVKPQVLVCDEPVSALDVSVQAQILNLLRSLQAEFNLTYVFISHDLSVMRQICSRIAVMYLGHVVELGDSEQIFERPRHPYTAALIAAVPRVSENGHRRERVVVGGDVPSAVDPPSGCVFHPRCPRFHEGHCDVVEPILEPAPGDSSHVAACHYPLENSA